MPVEIAPADTRQVTRMRFVARCPDPGAASQDFIVRARVSAMVLVTATAVAANEVLNDAQVTLDRRDITAIADPVAAPEAAVGQTIRRSLRAGEVLRTRDLASQVLVKRGDAVVMRAHIELVDVSTAGEALDAGARGALIRVRNAASGQVVRMRVTGPGMVAPPDAPLEKAPITP
jgi:flagella basal body P-ring formation protein FlgA